MPIVQSFPSAIPPGICRALQDPLLHPQPRGLLDANSIHPRTINLLPDKAPSPPLPDLRHQLQMALLHHRSKSRPEGIPDHPNAISLRFLDGPLCPRVLRAPPGHQPSHHRRPPPRLAHRLALLHRGPPIHREPRHRDLSERADLSQGPGERDLRQRSFPPHSEKAQGDEARIGLALRGRP